MLVSRCIAKSMYLEKPRQLIIWDGGSTYLNSVGNAISVPSRCYSQVMIASLKGELLKYC